MAEKRESVVTDEDQTKILEEAKSVVKTQAFYMKRCLDSNNLMDALKHASNMICELRTSLLSPRNYYSLYIEAFDQLRYLEQYLLEEKHGKRMSDLYELVQYAGNILPRLYLLVTVGSAYIKLKEAAAKDVLRDLVEMCRGVQHPTRGLFLRTYLSEVTKDKLPDTGSEYEGKGGNVKDSIEFILVNFTEMNKLWVRMQHQGAVREKDKRESERTELKLLVGKNIARLSQLEGVDLDAYKQLVLPKLVEQIVNCRDVIAQQYLMECIIQAFPDDYHLRTLETLLSTCTHLQPGINIRAIVVSLLDRLSNYALRGESIPEDIKVFNIFSSHIVEIVEQQSSMAIEDVLALEASLLNLTITCYPSQLENVDEVFRFACKALQAKNKEDIVHQACVKQMIKILTIPLDSYKDILTVLKLENYQPLIVLLQYEQRKRIAIEILRTTIDANNVFISQPEQVNKILEWIQPLVKDEQEQPEHVDDDDFVEEQNLVASLVHLFENENPEQLFAMYLTARKHFGQGGEKRIRHTLIPLVFCALSLAIRLKSQEQQDENWMLKTKKVFKFALETSSALAKTNLPAICLRLFLQCALTANHCGSPLESVAYEFITQAFVLYEEQISDSQVQFSSLQAIVGTLYEMHIFSEENYDTLITKTALHASKLLKKSDQCRAIYMVSHLFWCPAENKAYKNGKRVLECLQKALKVADACMDSSSNIFLFVEILNQYLFYFEYDCDAVNIQYLSGLIALINTNIVNMDASSDSDTSKTVAHYQNTLSYIKWKTETDPRYKEIVVKN
jgi:vacuolar protein sorting-associated protein 35